MTLLHQIFRQAQSSICLNSPVLLNLTLFPDRFTVLHINVTFQKVGTVCGTLSIALLPTFVPDRFTVLRIQITFQKVGTVCGTLSIVLFANVFFRPFQRVKNTNNVLKGRNCLRHFKHSAFRQRLFPTVSPCYT